MDIGDRGVRVLFNAKRFIIATILYIRGQLTMAELQRYTGLSWGDLDSNVRMLSKYGLVEARKVLTESGPRTRLRLTRKGEEAYEKLSVLLKNIISRAEEAKRETDNRDNRRVSSN